MNKRLEEFKDFLDGARSVYHAVAALVWNLEDEGYVNLSEGEEWFLQPGGKYYLTRGGSALIAFRIPQGTPRGFMMSASHADRPTFKLKENGELSGTYTRLSVEKYGGMLMGTWLDRPLSVAGRVLVDTDEGVQSRLVDIDRDLLLIPNVAIHMNRKANEGYAWNPAVDLLPLMGGKESKGRLQALLENEAGGPILGQDLYLYLRQKASVWGVDYEYISAPALDDLACVWCCAQGFLEAEESDAVPVLCVFDSEEVGSCTNQGADSGLLSGTLLRVCNAMELDPDRMLSGSFMLSADNAHAIHPNHPEYSDPSNAPMPGEGVVLKFNANQKYTTDGVSAAVFRKVCALAGEPVQTYYNRADLAGGSTLGNISLAHVSVPSADIGLAQLAMHSCYETAAVRDVEALQRVMQTYYGCTLEITGDGFVKVLAK